VTRPRVKPADIMFRNSSSLRSKKFVVDERSTKRGAHVAIAQRNRGVDRGFDVVPGRLFESGLSHLIQSHLEVLAELGQSKIDFNPI
jgi:hypothetical protein